MKKKVVILGAGLTGLVTAWKLSEKDIDVHIFELNKQVGGLARSFKIKNYTFDYGPHGFEPINEENYNDLKKLLGNDLINLGKKRIKIIFKKRKFDYPLRATTAIFRLGFFTSFRCFLDYIYYNFRLKILNPPDNSFEDWITNRFGKSIYKLFFRSYTEKVWGIKPSLLSKNFAEDRIPPISLIEAFKSFLKNPPSKPSKNNKVFDMHYPRKGIQQISDKLVDNIIKNKGKIYLNSNVKEIIMDGNKVVSVKILNNKKIKTIDCDFLVSTIPLNKLVEIIYPRPERNLICAIKSLKYRNMLFFFLVLKKDKVFEDHWIYFQDEDIIFNRAYDLSLFSPFLLPKGMTAVVVEMNGSYISKDKDELFSKVIDDFSRLGFFTKDEVLEYYYDVLDFAYPIYLKNYQDNINVLEVSIERVNNLVSCGRQGFFRYLDMHHCFDLGRIISKQIIDGHLDRNKIQAYILNKTYKHGTIKDKSKKEVIW